MSKHTEQARKKQECSYRSAYLCDRLYSHFRPLWEQLQPRLDRRLVSNLFGLVLAILLLRHRNHGLLLSELGGYLLEPEQAPAGTKRVSRVLQTRKWSSRDLEAYLWSQADQRVQSLAGAGQTVLAIGDESELEKPESLQLEGLCPVLSSKAKRLKRIKPGFFNPPGGRPIWVPGYHWLQVLVLGMQGAPTLAHLRWWTSRGEAVSDKRSQERDVLVEVSQRWGNGQVLHVWDGGFARAPWLSLAFVHAVRFVLRWPKKYRLLDEQGQLRKPGEISQGKRSWDHRQLWDARRRCNREVGVVAFPVQDKDLAQDLWLVVARRKGQSPWYLLTNEPIRQVADAWRVVLAYARRWQIEMAIRYDKCELAFESPRLRHWEPQKRLLLLAALAYSFLLSLLQVDAVDTVVWLLRHWCHRTGAWLLKVGLPLYRLRMALSRLWLAYPPPFLLLLRSGRGAD
jgi:hypothetical protein